MNFVKKIKLVYYPTSAKENKGINEAFTYIVNLVYKKDKEIRQQNIQLGEQKQKKKKNCC